MEKTMSNSTPTPAAHRLGLVGRKVGMTRIFTEEGESIPVTVLDVSNNSVTQVKSPETDGYAAVQVAYGTRRDSRVAKPQAGHYANAGSEAGTTLKEFRRTDERRVWKKDVRQGRSHWRLYTTKKKYIILT